MDNILKLLLGVLTISGMIALLVPSESPIAPPVESAPPQAAAPAPVAEVYEDDADVESESNDEESDDEELNDEDFVIGEPSIDGQPFGGSFDAPSSGANAVLDRMDNPSQTETESAPSNNNGNVVL